MIEKKSDPSSAPGPTETTAATLAVGRALLATLVVGAVLAAGLLPLPSAEIWASLAPGNCVEYCERHTHCVVPLAERPVILQPLNTWSNLAFVFAGFLAAFLTPHVGGWLFAISCCVLGVGSFLFHASVTLLFQWFDVVGMYVAESALLAWAIHRTMAVSYATLLPGVLVLDVVLAVYKWQLNTTLMMALMGAVIAWRMVGQVRNGHRTVRRALLPALLIVTAYAIRELDVRKVGCAPDSLLYQGHAVWHFLCAATLYATYRFFAPDTLPARGASTRPVSAMPSTPGVLLAVILAAAPQSADAGVLSFLGSVRDVDGPFGLAGAHGLGISPDGRNLYVASFVDHALVVFTRDLPGGVLRYSNTFFDQVDGVDGLMAATAVATSPDGRDVYVASYFGDALATFRRDPETGSLEFHEVFHNENVTGLSSPRGLAITPDGSAIYVATYYDDSLVVFQRDSASGRLTHVQTLTEGAAGVSGLFRNSSVAISPDGAHVYVGSEGGNALALFTVDSPGPRVRYAGAWFAEESGLADLRSPVALAISPQGNHLYALSADALLRFRRDAATGALHIAATNRVGVSEGAQDTAPTALAMTGDGRMLFVARAGDDSVSVFSRHPATGELTLLERVVDGSAGVDGLTGAHAVAVSPDDRFAYVAGQFDDAVAMFALAAPICATDCDGDGEVVIEELVLAVDIAASAAPPTQCPVADANRDQSVQASDLHQALINALAGCPA